MARDRIFEKYHQDLDAVAPELGIEIILYLETHYAILSEEKLYAIICEMLGNEILTDISFYIFLNMPTADFEKAYEETHYITAEQAQVRNESVLNKRIIHHEIIDNSDKDFLDQLRETETFKVYRALAFDLLCKNQIKKQEIDKKLNLIRQAASFEYAHQMLEMLIKEVKTALKEK